MIAFEFGWLERACRTETEEHRSRRSSATFLVNIYLSHMLSIAETQAVGEKFTKITILFEERINANVTKYLRR